MSGREYEALSNVLAFIRKQGFPVTAQTERDCLHQEFFNTLTRRTPHSLMNNQRSRVQVTSPDNAVADFLPFTAVFFPKKPLPYPFRYLSTPKKTIAVGLNESLSDLLLEDAIVL